VTVVLTKALPDRRFPSACVHGLIEKGVAKRDKLKYGGPRPSKLRRLLN
jgi:hypothetical protein